VLALEPAAAEAQDRPSVAEVIERGRQLRRQARAAEGVGADQEAQLHPRRQLRPGCQGQPALELRVGPVALVGEQVVVCPERVEARRFDPSGNVA
jgi:hypothetical protein